VVDVRRSLVLALSLAALMVPVGTARASGLDVGWSRSLHAYGFVDVDVSATGASAVVGGRDASGGRYLSAAVVAVYGPHGDLRWKDVWRPTSRCSAQASAVAFGTDGGVYVAGHWRCPSPSEIGTDLWFLRRYRADGTRGWLLKESRSAQPFTEGWSDANDLAALPGGGVVLAGSHTGCCDVSAGQDGWVLAFGADGSLRWTNAFEPAGYPTFTQDGANAVVVIDGAVYVGGAVADGTIAQPWIDREPVVLRLSATGTTVWTHVVRDAGRPPQDFDEVVSITVAAGRPVALMRFEDRARTYGRLLALRADGTTIWSTPTTWWPGAVAGTPAGRLFTLAWKGEREEIRAFDARGRLLWSNPLAWEVADLAYGDGSLFASGYLGERARLVRFA
jgi:hypothetical protein